MSQPPGPSRQVGPPESRGRGSRSAISRCHLACCARSVRTSISPGRRRWPHAPRRASPPLGAPCPRAWPPAPGPARRRGHVLLARAVRVLRHGQEVEDPAAAVVRRTPPSARFPARRAASSPPMSCSSASSPISTSAGAPVASAAPAAEATHAVDPVGAAVGEEADPLGRRREEGLDVADRHRGADPDQRALGQAGLERGADLGLERVAAPRPGRAATSASAARQASSQPGRAPRRASPARPPGRRRWAPRRRAAALGATRGLVPGRVRVEHHLLARRRARRAGAWTWACRRRAGPGRGACSRGEALVAQQHVVVGHHVGAVVVRRSARRRSARPAPATRAPRPAARPGRPPRSARRAAHDRPARTRPIRSASAWTSSACGPARARAPRSRAARPSRPCPVGGVELLAHRRQRLAEREVQVHRTRPPARAVQKARHASARWWTARCAPRLVVAHLHEPLGGRAVELDLVDRLAGAHVAQLRRPVGGEHDQRHPRLVRLDHGRQRGWRPRCPTCTSRPPAARSPWPCPAP